MTLLGGHVAPHASTHIAGGSDSLATTYAPAPAVVQAQQTRSLYDLSVGLASVTPPPFGPVGAMGPGDVVVYPSETYQEIVGAGAAITDAAAYCLMTYLTPSARAALLSELFSPAQNNWGTVRVGIGATDFQQSTPYTYDDMPGGQVDTGLINFSVTKDQARIIPVLQQILAINPRLRVIAAPWSPPTWMLSSGSAFTKGSILNSASYSAYAQYLVKFVQAYAAYGIPIYALSIQNEPIVPSEIAMTAAQQQSIIQAVGAAFDSAGLDTKILAHDENWGVGATATTVVSDATTLGYLDGVAWHGYGGSPLAMSQLRRSYPKLDHHLTEWRALQAESLFLELQGMAGGYVAQGLRNWATSITLWNLILDQNGAPNNGFTGRRGVVTVNNSTGAITRNGAYYALTHLSKFLVPGSRRCRSTSYSAPYQAYTVYPSAVTTAAWINPDGSVCLYAYNGAGSSQTFQAIDGRTGQGFPVTLASGELSTFVWGTSAQSAPGGTAAASSAPSAPAPTATGGAGQVSLAWAAPSSTWPVAGYTVLRGATAGSEVAIATLPPTATSYLDYVAAGSYSYKLAATNRSGTATSASTAATATAAAVPATPVVTATPSNGQVLLSWPAPTPNGSDITSYAINRSTTTGTETLLATGIKGSTSYSDTTITNGTTYFYTVTATNTTGTSAASTEVSATPQGVTAGTPVTAQNTALAAGAALSWTHTVNAGDTLLAVLISASATSPTSSITGVTCGGVALTKRADLVSSASGTSREASIYTLVNPPVGAQTIVATAVAAGATYAVGATSVALQNTLGTFGTAQTATTASGTSLSLTTTSATGSMVLAAAAARSTATLTIGGSETALRDDIVSSNLAVAHTKQAGGAGVTTSATWTTADNGALVAVPIS